MDPITMAVAGALVIVFLRRDCRIALSSDPDAAAIIMLIIAIVGVVTVLGIGFYMISVTGNSLIVQVAC